MKIIALFGLAGGAVVAAGQLTAAQWHVAGAALVALVLRYGLTALPWLLAALFARLWWKQRWLTSVWRSSYGDQSKYYAGRLAERQSTPKRKRATR
jgi:hypothetical protein